MNQKQQRQSQIEMSLRMIEHYSKNHKHIHDMLVSFYYSAKMLDQYYTLYSQEQLFNTALFYRFHDRYNAFFINRDLLGLVHFEVRQKKQCLEMVRATKQFIKKWEMVHVVKPGSSGVLVQNMDMRASRYSGRRSKVDYIPVVGTRQKLTISGVENLFMTKEKESEEVPINTTIKWSNQQPTENSNGSFHPHTTGQDRANKSDGRSQRSQRRGNPLNGLDQTFIDHLDSMKGSNISSQKNTMFRMNDISAETKLTDLVNLIIKEYGEHKLDLAAELTNQALSMMDTMDPSALRNLGTQKDQLYEILYEYREMMECYSNFNLPGWKLDKEEKGIKIYLKTDKPNEVGVLIQAQLNVDPLKFFIIAAEIDLFHKFVPFCYDNKELKRMSRNTVYGTSKINLPIPFVSDREIFFYASAINRLATNGTIFVYSKTMQDDKRAQQKYQVTVPPVGKCVRFSYIFFTVECQILGRNKLRVRMASSVDMKMNLLPNFVISVAARKFTVDTFMAMLKYEKTFEKTEWAKQRTAKRQVYDYFERIIDEHTQRTG